MKNIVPLAIGGSLIVAGVVGGLVLRNKPPDSPGELLLREQNQKQIITETPNGGVPLPTEEDIIRTFFALIDEGRSTEAVAMMGKAVTDNNNYQQQWAVQFSAFESAKLTSVEAGDPPVGEASWTDTTHIYKVILKAQMKTESAEEAMPYFGWENGENTRWIELIKEGGNWKIQGIATGP